MPIINSYNYTANAIPLQTNSSSQFNNTSWTGIIEPNIPYQYIHVGNWASSDVTVWVDWINERFQLDVTTPLFEDRDGYHAYLCMCTYNTSTGVITKYPGVNYTVNYNPNTRILDFTGTYSGFPTCITIIPKDPATNQWLTDYYYFNVYANLKMILTSVASAPELRNSDRNNFNVIKKSAKLDVQKIEFKNSYEQK